jgi:peptidoglycan-N-acetylglucosamine deacetylase
LTIDDGYCEECVAGYVAFAEGTGIGNHTWSHPDLRFLGDGAIRSEIERNESWIEHTFGITARPWFRPPYGSRDARTDEVAARLGYTRILMWNGTLGDATVETPQELLGLADKWVRSGAIVLGHANHPTVLNLFGQIQAIIAARGLQPVTLDSMFGTTRATG